MNEAQTIAATINKRLRDVRRGSLQIFGDWFGRPHDNIHIVVKAESNDDILRIHFNEGETLDIWAPTGLEVTTDRFTIKSARKVRWEWFYYGRKKTAENRYFLEYTRRGAEIAGATNVDCYTHAFATNAKDPAVQIT